MRYIKRERVENNVVFDSKKKDISFFSVQKKRISFKMLMGTIITTFSPFLGLMIFFYAFLEMYEKIIKKYFRNADYVNFYDRYFRNITADKVVTVVGYEVYDDELNQHLSIVNADEQEAVERLTQKQKAMSSYKNIHRHIGFDHKFLTTHLAIFGKTGAGKTETVRSIVNDILKAGGGVNFTDGKADEKMLQEFYNQAKDLGRETSRLAINFLKPESISESNTMSFLNIMHPIKIIEFLASLAKKEDSGGDGNSEYFFNKGKAMLFPIVSSAYIRNKYYKEGLNFDKLQEYQSPINMVILYATFYSMLRDIEDIIRYQTSELSAEVETMIGIIVNNPEFEYIEKTIEIVTQFSAKANLVYEEVGITYSLLKEIYQNSFVLLKNYLSTTWNQYDVYLPLIGKIIYAMGQKKGKKFFIPNEYENCYSILEIKEMYKEMKKVFQANSKSEAMEFIEKYELEDNGLDIIDIQKAGEGIISTGKSVEDPPEDAVQQHAYAQQQWTQLFQVLSMFSHVFGANEGDIEPVDLLRNNKFLYTLLPPLDLQPAQVQILGKMQIMAIREVASLALGGEKLSVHKTLKNIYADKFTPKPFYLFVLDEYGAYAVDGIDTILAQVRSLNIGTIISIQDFVSLKAGGTNETAQKRALGNLSKMFYKLEDKDAIEWIEGMIEKSEVLEAEIAMDESGELHEQVKMQSKEKNIFDPKKVRDFGNGFCVLQQSGDVFGTVYMQTFYRGGREGTIQIKRFIPASSII